MVFAVLWPRRDKMRRDGESRRFRLDWPSLEERGYRSFIRYLRATFLTLRPYRIFFFILGGMYKVYLIDPKSKNKFVKTVTLSKKQEEILKEVNPMLLSKCSV